MPNIQACHKRPPLFIPSSYLFPSSIPEVRIAFPSFRRYMNKKKSSPLALPGLGQYQTEWCHSTGSQDDTRELIPALQMRGPDHHHPFTHSRLSSNPRLNSQPSLHSELYKIGHHQCKNLRTQLSLCTSRLPPPPYAGTDAMLIFPSPWEREGEEGNWCLVTYHFCAQCFHNHNIYQQSLLEHYTHLIRASHPFSRIWGHSIISNFTTLLTSLV